MSIKDFYNVLFDVDEYTCFGATPYENQSYPIDEGNLSVTTRFFTINPLVKGRTRKAANVKKYRNLLFEVDNISVQDQAAKIKASGLPYSTATFSGSKSIHWIISLIEPIEEREEYTAIWKAIHAALLKWGVEADTATKDPARFSRCPGQIRDNGKEQKLLKVVGRISIETIKDWLIENEIEWTDYLPTQEFKPAWQNELYSNVEDDLKWEWIEKYYMKNDEYVEGKRHDYQVKMAYLLLRTGMSAQTIDEYFKRKFGEISTGIVSVTRFENESLGEAIYVPSMEERKAYYKRLETQEQNEIRRQRTIEGYMSDIVRDITTGIQADGESEDRYMVVGTEYYKKDAESDRLIKWSKTMFEKLYGGNAIPPRLYDAFHYEPDFISESFPYDLGARGQLRNRFVRPQYTITPGDWSTIEAGLRHGFGDMYDLIITYCAISLKYPKQCLPLIWLVGPENTGKSAVIKIFELLVGLTNARRVNGKIIEGDYTGYLMDIQLLIIEESGGWKNPTAVMNMLKDLVTMTGDIVVNPKYGVQQDYPFFAKIIMSTNNYEDIPLDGAATRFLISEMTQKPPQIKDYYKKIENEIGHFVHHLLNNVQFEYPREGRLYFEPEEYSNDIKDFIKDLSKSDLVGAIEIIISDFFEHNPDEAQCYFDLKSLKNALSDYVRVNKLKIEIGDKDIKTAIKKHFGLERSNPLSRPDSLTFTKLEKFKPERRSAWWVLERSEILGADAIFDSNKIVI